MNTTKSGMVICLRLGWLEWLRSVAIWHKSKRDFLWLTLLLALALILALLIWGSRQGLLDSFMNVSLGYVKGEGIPVWVVANLDEQSTAIDRSLLEDVKRAGMSIYPYQEVESSVFLPGAKTADKSPVWGAPNRDNERMSHDMPFKGWAVSVDDPLWKRNASTAYNSHKALPLEVVLNKSLFQKYFQCGAYLKILKKRLPYFSMDKPAAVSANTPACLESGLLWLEVNVNRRNTLGTVRKTGELLAFRIHWAERDLVALGELSFLFPLSTLHALKEAVYSPAVKYYPEGEGGSVTRARTLILWQKDGDEALLRKIAGCLHAKTKGNRILAKWELPLERARQCAEQYGIALQTSPEQILEEPYLSIPDTEKGHLFDYRDNRLTVACHSENPDCRPCETLVPAWKKLSKSDTGCHDVEASRKKATADVNNANGGYQQAFIYTERNRLFQTQDDIKNKFKRGRDKQQSALRLHPTYEDALLRLGFIDQVMKLLNSSYSKFFAVFLGVLLFVQIGIVAHNRRHDYGVFLAKGMSCRHLHAMIYLQITLSFFAAMGFVLPAVAAIRWLLAGELDLIAESYEQHVQIDDLNLLPLLWLEYGMVSVFILILGLVIAAGLLAYICALKNAGREPAHLL